MPDNKQIRIEIDLKAVRKLLHVSALILVLTVLILAACGAWR